VLPLAHSFAHQPFALATNAHGGEPGRRAVLATFSAPAFVPSLLGRSEVDGRPVIRGWNAADEATALAFGVPAAPDGTAERVDLMENPVEPLGGGSPWPLALRPWEIATLKLGGERETATP
jgi:alpha-mannosidase